MNPNRTRRGPVPYFTEHIDVCFSPEQFERIKQLAHVERKSANAVVREAVELLFATQDEAGR